MNGRLLVALILLVLGIGLTLDRLDVWDFGGVLSTWWPVFVVLAGVIHIAQSRSSAWGWGLVVLGLLLLLWRLEIIPDLGPFVLPGVLIIVALALLAGMAKRSKPPVVEAQRWSRTAVFGGVEERVRGKAFRGGSATALFGGVELDLREAQIANEGADLETTAVFGGVTVRVPEGVRVEVSGTPIFGGFENKAGSGGDGPVLRVTGLALFGGVEIK